MSLVDFQDRVDTYLAARSLKPRSEIAYREALRYFHEWAHRVGLDDSNMNSVKLSRYESWLRTHSGGLSENTIKNRVSAVRRFYAWLALEGMTPLSDLVSKKTARPPMMYRELLSVDDMRGMWGVSKDDRDRTVFGLLAFNSLRLEDVEAARIEDLGERDGLPILRLRTREAKQVRPYAVIAPVLLDAIHRNVGARRTGALALTQFGKPAPRRTINDIVRRLARDAGVTVPVTSLTLTFSMRAIAMERGFSYVGVLRTTGILNTRQLSEMVARAPYNLSLDPGLRMARLVATPDDATVNRLQYAEVLLHESDVPLATAAMLAGATLEEHLRALVAARKLTVRTTRLNIMVFATALRSAGLINEQEVQRLATLAALRDTASHGWFDEVTRANVVELIRETRAFIERHAI